MSDLSLYYCNLSPQKSVLRIHGKDTAKFLQGLMTNDVHKLSSESIGLYSSFLTSKGFYLYDITLIYSDENDFLILISNHQADAFMTHLNKYKLRSEFLITDISHEYQTYIMYSPLSSQQDNLANYCTDFKNTHPNIILFQDPRHDQIGYYLLTKSSENQPIELQKKEYSNYQNLLYYHKVALTESLIEKKSLILQYRFNELNAISFEKGCYMGQETINRTHRKGLLKQFLYSVEFHATNEDDLKKLPGSTITNENNDHFGTLLSFQQETLYNHADDLIYIGHIMGLISAIDSLESYSDLYFLDHDKSLISQAKILKIY